MRIGLTYDLQSEWLAMGYGLEETAEFDQPETIQAIAQALESLGHTPEQIGGLQALSAALLQGRRWDLVFNICEGMHGLAREAQVPALLDAYQIPYTFSDPMVLSLTLHKGMTKRVIRDGGIATPDFALIEREDDLNGVNLPYPLFAKPVAEGTGKGVTENSLCKTPAQLRQVTVQLLNQFRQPVLVETYLPGREFTVGLLGTGPDSRVHGVLEVTSTHLGDQTAYTWANKKHCHERVVYTLVDDPQARAAAQTALEAWKVLGCRDGGRMDLRCDAQGRPHFIEVNPLAGLHPVDSDLCIMGTLAGKTYQALIGDIVQSALARLGGAPTSVGSPQVGRSCA
ncbi:MAG: D-alanine--D-alanine ligase [Deltaproteobacteria bacterium]|nr:D-alanine--D-alanine ligase [Deltaproteobacteria bacterium]